MSRWHGWREFHWAEAINHGTTLRSSTCRVKSIYWKLATFPFLLYTKVIFQSSLLCSSGYITSAHTLTLNDPNMTPRFRHHLCNYAHLYTLRLDIRCILRTVHMQLHVRCTGFAWPRRTMCRPSINQDTRYLDFFL